MRRAHGRVSNRRIPLPSLRGRGLDSGIDLDRRHGDRCDGAAVTPERGECTGGYHRFSRGDEKKAGAARRESWPRRADLEVEPFFF